MPRQLVQPSPAASTSKCLRTSDMLTNSPHAATRKRAGPSMMERARPDRTAQLLNEMLLGLQLASADSPTRTTNHCKNKTLSVRPPIRGKTARKGRPCANSGTAGLSCAALVRWYGLQRTRCERHTARPPPANVESTRRRKHPLLVRRTRCAADRVASASGPCEKQLGNREALLPDQLMSDCANAANALHEKQASTATHDQVIDETSSKNDANGTTKPWHPEPSQSDQRAQRSLADEAVFRSFVHRNGERQGGVDLPSLSMGNFCKLVRQTLGICEQRIARRLFRVFDVNQDGRVSSSEYVRTMQLIGFGTPRENMKLFFDLYDMDQSGSIHQNQVRAMLCEGHRELWEHIMFAEDVMCAVDKTGAVLTEEQFYACCEQTPHIFDAFVNGFPAAVADTLSPDESAITGVGIGAHHEDDANNGDSSRSSSRSHAHWREMRKNKSSSWSTARELWVLMMKATASASASSRVMDYAAFQRVMVSRFDPNSDLDRMLCARLFACFDSNGDGDVSVREFMQGLQRVFRGSAADQSAFYFALFDLDGDGEISEAELCRVLVTRRSKLGLAQWSEGQLVTEVGLIMQLVDGNHSGTIDLEEIKRASIEYPHVLQCFEACVFGGGTT